MGDANRMTVFECRRDVSTHWLNKSNDFCAAAAAVDYGRQEPQASSIVTEFGFGRGFSMGAAVPSVFRMLCGLSLELLYKAVAVSQGRDVPFTHDLVRLAEHAGVQLEEADKSLLRIYTTSVVWDGKYPIPKDEAEWVQLCDLESEHLFDRSAGSRFCKPNRALSWEGFMRLRELALTHYVPSNVSR